MSDSTTPETDPILVDAMRQRESALQDVAGWEEFIRRYKVLRDSRVASGRTPEVTSRPTAAKPLFGGHRPQKSPEVIRTVQLARRFIQEQGRPVGTTELYNVITKAGIRIKGKKPKNSLDNRLRYSSDFVTTGGRGWWLKDVPLPTANGSAAGPGGMPAAQENYQGEP